jgi:hypothetical protein
MKRNDFIMNATADYLECLQDANKALEKCRIYGIDPITAYTDTSTGHIVDIEYPQANASQLEVLCVELADQMERLEVFYNAIYALATAKNELESVDLYEFDEE